MVDQTNYNEETKVSMKFFILLNIMEVGRISWVFFCFIQLSNESGNEWSNEAKSKEILIQKIQKAQSSNSTENDSVKDRYPIPMVPIISQTSLKQLQQLYDRQYKQTKAYIEDESEKLQEEKTIWNLNYQMCQMINQQRCVGNE